MDSRTFWNENTDLMANQAALMPTYIIPRAEKSDWLNFIKQSIRAKANGVLTHTDTLLLTLIK